MVIIQRLFANGYELALIAGGAAAFGEPLDGGGPEYVLAALEDALYVWLQAFVVVDRYFFLIVADTVYMLEFVFLAVFGELRRAYKVIEHLLLRVYGIVHEVINSALAQLDEPFECRTDDAHTPKPPEGGFPIFTTSFFNMGFPLLVIWQLVN